MKEYRVVYDYTNGSNTYTIEAGQNRWIPSREIAEKILSHKQKEPYFIDTKLYLEEREAEPHNRKDCRTYNGKTVYNPDWFYFDALSIGDYVEEEIVNDIINSVPPACMRYDCSQCGEASNHMEDERTGRFRATYSTFKRVDGNTWEYCGDCFIGENVQHGKELQYV